MASKTMRTKLKRKRRDQRMGHKRKAKNENQGTTKSDKELFGDK
jgi:hypothetical protein